MNNYPIFGPAAFDLPMAKVLLGGLSVFRYFQVPRAAWRPKAGQTFELATLPNDEAITRYQKDVYEITRGDETKALLESLEYKKYHSGVQAHFDKIERLVGPGSELKAYQLAPALDAMLKDQGKDDKDGKANLTEFWTSSDPKVQTLRRQVERLHDEAKYGDAFVIGGQFGKGRVVAVMTTAGKDWNNWAGGSDASLVYQPFIWETVNYLSSQGSDANLTVGTRVHIDVDTTRFKRNENLKVTRSLLYKSGAGQAGQGDAGRASSFGQAGQRACRPQLPLREVAGAGPVRLRAALRRRSRRRTAAGHVQPCVQRGYAGREPAAARQQRRPGARPDSAARRTPVTSSRGRRARATSSSIARPTCRSRRGSSCFSWPSWWPSRRWPFT